jgi:hypothetical protein
LIKSRIHLSEHLTRLQYGRIVEDMGAITGLEQTQYGIHIMERTKPSLISKKLKT